MCKEQISKIKTNDSIKKKRLKIKKALPKRDNPNDQ